MSTSSSSAKRERQNRKRRMRNRETKSEVRTAIRKFQRATDLKDQETAQEKLNAAIRLLDKADTKGVLHRNTVSRKKSRLYAQFNALHKEQ